MRAERLLLYCASAGLAKSPPLNISVYFQPSSSFFFWQPQVFDRVWGTRNLYTLLVGTYPTSTCTPWSSKPDWGYKKMKRQQKQVQKSWGFVDRDKTITATWKLSKFILYSSIKEVGLSQFILQLNKEASLVSRTFFTHCSVIRKHLYQRKALLWQFPELDPGEVLSIPVSLRHWVLDITVLNM